MICQICNKDFKNATHISKKHKISVQEYYDTYIKKDGEDVCKICGKKTNFIGINYGYHTYCSKKCASKDEVLKQKQIETAKKNNLLKYGVENPQQRPEIKEKTKQTCLLRYGTPFAIGSNKVKQKISIVQKSKLREYDGLIKTDKVIEEYGTGWCQTPVRKKLDIKIIKKGRYGYISIDELPKIQQYYHSDFCHSKKEVFIKESIQYYYDKELVQNTKLVIKPYQLDIYLPELKLAIEYNSRHYHCIEFGVNKDYHLMKSLLCRDQGIRLIHIYEFENFDEQLKLLKDLILGTDNYPKNDFNKNNLIDNIPNPEIVYQTKSVTIYGAGKLY